MASLRAIREIHVQHTSEGAEKVRRELEQQTAANDRLAKSSESVATATETSARRQQSAAGGYDRLRSSLDQTYRAQQQFERGQRTLDRAFQQGVVDAQEYGRVQEMLRSRLHASTVANDNSARAAARNAVELSNLRAAFDPAYASARRMAEEVDNLARLERAGIEVHGGYDAALGRIIEKYDEVGQAARRAAEAQAAYIQSAREAQAAENARQVAEANQGAFNRVLGVRPAASGAARASAAVFEEDAASLARLRAELNPVAQAQARLTEELERYQRWARQGQITTEELAVATSRSRQRFDEFRQSLDRGADSGEGMLSRLGALASRIGPLMATLGVGLGGVSGLALLGDSSRRMEEAERAARRLEGVLEATGAAAGLSGREIAAFADEIERNTGRAAEETMQVAAQLATFTSIGREEFQRTILVANDMSEVFGGSLQSSLDAVARALDDPIKGFQNLRQRGFALEEQELQLVLAFMAVGDSAAAQGVVLQNLERQVGGASTRAFDGLTKAQADATKAAEDAFDAFNRVSGAHEARIRTTRAFGSAMAFANDNMETIVPVAGTLTALVGARLATSFLTSTAAANAFGGAMTMITTRAGLASTAMALLGGPIGIGVTTVTAVAAGLLLWARNGDEANRSLSEHETIVAAIRDRYREADEARRQLTRGELEQDYRDLETRAAGERAAMEAAQARLRTSVESQMFTLGRSSAPGAGPLAGLLETFLRGEMSAKSFGTELQTLRRTNEDVARILDEIALRDASFELLAQAAGNLEDELAATNVQLGESERRLDDIENSAVAAANAFASFQANLSAIREFDPVFTRQAKMQADLATATGQHAEAVGNLNRARESGGSQAEFDRGLTEANEALRASTAAISGLTDARARLDAYESNARIGGMDPRAQAIARERENYQTLRQSIIDAGAASGDLLGVGSELARAQSAHEQVVGQLNARFDEQDASARRSAAGQRTVRDAGNEAVAALERQIAALRQSEGQSAAAEFRAHELARALQDAAASDGGVISEKTRRDIDDAAHRIGILTDQLAALREEEQRRERVSEALANLQFEGSIAGLSDVDQQVARQLHQLKLSHADLDGQRIAGQIRYNASLDETRERLEDQRQLVQNVASTFLDIFTDSSSDSFFDRILKGLADISRQFAELGKQRFLDIITGGSVGYTSGFPAPGQRSVAPIGVPLAANQNSPSGISVGAVTALNDNLRQSSRSALDVAKQFDGLNERADSKVLDSFMQASGTWGSLSAADTAWCAAFANAAIAKAGGQGTNSNLASSFMDWGMGTNNPKPGDIVVLKPQARGASGHVTFFEGFDANGNVRGFGGNQSHMARTSTYGADQVRAFRTATRDGYVDAVRQIATGQSGVIASGPSMSGAASTAVAGGWGGFGPVAGQGNAQLGMLGRAQQFMQSPLGMGGMNAFSAFGAGMSSGSPVSGGFSGALGAFGMGLGPVGMIAGGLAGIVGGLFGRRRQRREAERQRREQERQQQLQAQQQLEQQLPAILELQDTLLDRASGTLMKEKARIESQIKQYQTLAATAKNQTEIDRLNSMADSLNDYMERQYDQLRLTASSVIQSLAAGRGLEPEFAKAVSAVREQSLTIRNYLADLTAAAGAGSAEVQAATAAGREQLLRMLSGAEEVTEIWTRLDALTGTASQLSTELQKLGMSAEDAGRAVSDHLNRGIGRMRDEFVQGITDETAEGMGLGYLPQLRSLMERRETMRADATSLGADPALVDRWFGVQARNILDQAGLLDKEIAPLVQAFPELANVLGDASAKIERSLADAENDLRTAYQRVRQFADQLAAFRDDIKLDRNLSTLGPEERLLEAQKQFRTIAEKAAAGDAEAQGELIGLSRSYLDEAKAFYTTSEAYYAIFREVDGTLKSTEAKAVAELDLAKGQYDALLKLDESVLTIPQALAAMDAAQAARDLSQAQALQAYVQAMNPQAAVPSYQAPQPIAPVALPTPAPSPEPTPPPVQTAPPPPLLYPWEDGWNPGWGGISPNWANKKHGGVIGFYGRGGVVGNGIWNEDSVFARYAGGGTIGLAGGEGILTAPAMQRPGVRDFMEAANANRLPELRMPQIAMPSVPAIRGQDNRELVAEIRALRSDVVQVRQAVGLAGTAMVDSVDRGTRVNQEQAAEARRRRAAP